MAKTKRRSCKGGRKSRKCRGGTKDSYKTPYWASSEERGFGSSAQGTSHFAERYSMNPLPGIRENIGAAAGYLVNKLDDARIGVDRLKRKASASARGLGASALRSIGLRSPHLDERKLVTVPADRKLHFGLVENAADRLYIVHRNGKLYEAMSEHLGPIGYWPLPRSDEMTAQFLPGHEPKTGQTWAIVVKDH